MLPKMNFFYSLYWLLDIEIMKRIRKIWQL